MIRAYVAFTDDGQRVFAAQSRSGVWYWACKAIYAIRNAERAP